MNVWQLVAAGCLAAFSSNPLYAGNLDGLATIAMPSPLCGINPNYPAPPPNPNPNLQPMPGIPFAFCKSIGGGMSVDSEAPLGEGRRAMIQLLIVLQTRAGEKLFQQLGDFRLNCRPGPFSGPGIIPAPGPFGGPRPGAGPGPFGGPTMPSCTKEAIQTQLAQYEAQPNVAGFRQLSQQLDTMDLSNKDVQIQLNRATAVLLSTDRLTSFKEVSDLLVAVGPY